MTDLATIPIPTTPTAMALPDSTDIEDWVDLCLPVLRAHNASMWWIGDMLLFAEAHYDDTEDQLRIRRLVERSGVAAETARAARWVAKSIPAVRRREHVPWGHHQVVAGLPAEQADRILADAQRDGLSNAEVRAAVRRLTATPATGTDEGPAPDARSDFVPWLDRTFPLAKSGADLLARLDADGWMIVRKP